MKIEWSDRAAADYEQLLDYIARENPGNALLVAQRIDKSIRILMDHHIGRTGPRPGTFKFYVSKTSHFIVYRFLNPTTLQVIAILHAARDWDRLNWDERL